MVAGRGMSTMLGIENGGGARPGVGAHPEPRPGFDRISLRRLVLIRWIAVAGQAVSLLVVHYLFDYSPDMEYLEIVSPADFKTDDMPPATVYLPPVTPWK